LRDGLVATVVASFEPDRLLSVSSAGKWAARLPLHQTACGKVLLAHMDPAEWQDVRDRLDLWPGSPKTIGDLAELERHLELVREQGLAVDDEEAELGIRSIAAPVRDGGGKVIAAIDIVGPKLRLTDEAMAEFKPLVRHCALSISRALGHGAL
jgi:DNA-binding IclR family transcriptional regulator